MTATTIRLFLARHGRTEWNLARRFQGRTDIPLDDVGRAEAAEFAQVLRGRIDAVVSSDLSRASETARIVTDVLALPMLALDPDLRERGYGIFEGLNREECIARHPEAWAARGTNPNFTPPGGEPHSEVIARMQRALERAVALAHGKHARLLVVGHGSALRMFLEVLSGRPERPIANLGFREVMYDGTRFALV